MPTSAATADTRTRIVEAAIALLTTQGRAAVSTRAVSAAAGVQAPAIYRQFGDMTGLLHAAAGEIFARYLHEKRVIELTADPVADLRRGWDHHVAFGLANPHAYPLIKSEEAAHVEPSALREGHALLQETVARVAAAGRLRVTVPRAAAMISAACGGVTLALIGTPEGERDLQLSRDLRESVFAAILLPQADMPESRPGASRAAMHAIALRAVLDEAPALSAGEQALLAEWLDRIAARR